MTTRGSCTDPRRVHWSRWLAGVAGLAIVVPAVNGTAAEAGALRETTRTITVGGRARTWLSITSRTKLAATAPILVVLSGISASAGTEAGRDGLAQFTANGGAMLVYPYGVGESWNAGGCCGTAAREHVNDVAFLQALVATVDPGHLRPVYLIGYSNGGRLTYRLACTDPALFDGLAVVKAMPEPGCVVTQPVILMQIDSTDDTAVPLRPGDRGKEHPAATTEVTRLRTAGDCPAAGTTRTTGSLRLTTWNSCAAGARLAFAVYTGGGHDFPPGSATTPSAATIIWRFLTTAR